MAAERSPERTAVTLVAAFIAALVVSLVIAPAVTGGFCNDSADPAETYCGSLPPRSIIGLETNMWVWIGALLAIAVITGCVLLRRRSRRA